LSIQKRSLLSIMRTEELAKQVIETLKACDLTLTTAESCTGGGVGYALTAVPGSSAVYLGGIISYTDNVKHSLLGVSKEILQKHGAVSYESAKAMSEGVQKNLCSHIGISVTGLAGPDSDSSGKPVGLVYIGATFGDCTLVREHVFSGDRAAVRVQAIDAALKLSLELMNIGK